MARKIRLTIKRTVTVRTRVTRTVRTFPIQTYIGADSRPALPDDALFCDDCDVQLDEERRCPECGKLKE
jgi:hypothetical protein